MATVAQIRKIHVLKDALDLRMEEYISLLSNFQAMNGARAVKSTDLTVRDASLLIEKLEQLIDQRPELKLREYASPRQRGLIMALWRNVSRVGKEAGYRQTLVSFLRRRFHLSQFERLPRRKVSKVINALRIMNRRKNRESVSGSFPETGRYWKSEVPAKGGKV